MHLFAYDDLVCQHCAILLLLLLLLLQTMPYRLNEETGIIDYDMLEKTAKLFRPKLIVAGAACCVYVEKLCVKIFFVPAWHGIVALPPALTAKLFRPKLVAGAAGCVWHDFGKVPA
jgi:hypothetical protein